MPAIITSEVGAGPPVVLGHALALDSTTLEPLVRPLAADHRVVTWDAPGHGRSDGWPAGWQYADVADALAVAIRALGIGRAIFGGVSQGGYVSLQLALRHPDLVAGLVLISCAAGPFPPDSLPARRQETRRWVDLGIDQAVAVEKADRNFGPDWGDRHRWISHWRAAPGARYADAYEAAFTRPDLRTTGLLARVTCPALIICGEHDQWATMDGARDLASRLSGAGPAVLISDGYHNPQLVQPEATLDAIRTFLGLTQES